MKYESTSDKPNSSDKKLLSWDELLKKGALLKDTIQRLSLTPDRPYLVTKSCTDGTFQKGDLIFLEPGRDLFCPKPASVSPPYNVHGIIWILSAFLQMLIHDSRRPVQIFTPALVFYLSDFDSIASAAFPEIHTPPLPRWTHRFLRRSPE